MVRERTRQGDDVLLHDPRLRYTCYEANDTGIWHIHFSSAMAEYCHEHYLTNDLLSPHVRTYRGVAVGVLDQWYDGSLVHRQGEGLGRL